MSKEHDKNNHIHGFIQDSGFIQGSRFIQDSGFIQGSV
jgi:hypothetical protein